MAREIPLPARQAQPPTAPQQTPDPVALSNPEAYEAAPAANISRAAVRSPMSSVIWLR